MSSRKIVLWGGTGQAIVLEEILSRTGYEILALFDNRAIHSPFTDIPIFYKEIGFKNWLKDHQNENLFFSVAIGGSLGKARTMIHDYLKQQGLIPLSIIHDTAFVSGSANIDEGCQILANATICARTSLGKATIINTAASIDHECQIGKGCHIGPGANLAGLVEIDDFSFIGMGAVVLPRIKIGKNVIIGAGSIVTKNIGDNCVVYGNPAKIKKQKKNE